MKKTFKVDELSLGRDYNGFGWIVSGIDTIVTEGLNHFDDDEWDMEVTFTKKAPDFFPGWFLYSDVPEGYDKEIEYFTAPPPNNGWERVHARN